MFHTCQLLAGELYPSETFSNSGMTGLAALNWKAVLLAAVLLVLTRWVKPTKGLHPILFILASAVVGVVFSF